MSGFALDWLDLRRDADTRARSGSLLHTAATRAGKHARSVIVDLGSGAGATVMALTPYLQTGADWRLVDNDASLLAVAQERCGGDGIESVLFDLSKHETLPLRGAHLVTASALLDLVSARWIDSLVEAVRKEGADFYAALIADGMMEWSLPHPADEAVSRAFNRHLRSDKGFGPALGGAAAAYAHQRFEAAGYDVQVEPSPWHLGVEDKDLIRALVAGVAMAASETGEIDRKVLTDWRAFRLADAGTGGCRVGHYDLLASPAT